MIMKQIQVLVTHIQLITRSPENSLISGSYRSGIAHCMQDNFARARTRPSARNDKVSCIQGPAAKIRVKYQLKLSSLYYFRG